MTDFRTLCEQIDKYETQSLAEGWPINYRSLWEGVKFVEIVADCKRFGLTEHSWSTKDELMIRIGNWVTFSLKDVTYREKLHIVFDAERAVDAELGTNLCELDFNGKTPDKIADEWEEEERWEKEEEARQECIDYCANFIYADGLVDTLDEAYELAEMVH